MPKSGSDAFDYMTPNEVQNYREYMRRHRHGEEQSDATRAGNTAYSNALKRVRAQKRRAMFTLITND